MIITWRFIKVFNFPNILRLTKVLVRVFLLTSLSPVLTQQYLISAATLAGKCVVRGGVGYVAATLIDEKKSTIPSLGRESTAATTLSGNAGMLTQPRHLQALDGEIPLLSKVVI